MVYVFQVASLRSGASTLPYAIVSEEILLGRIQIKVLIRIPMRLLLRVCITTCSKFAWRYEFRVEKLHRSGAFDNVKTHQSIHGHTNT